MRKDIRILIYIIAVISLLFSSCAGNTFSFDEEKQEFVVDECYFGDLDIESITNNSYFQLRQKNNNKDIKKIKLNQLDNYLIMDYSNDSILKSIPFEKNSMYKISHSRDGDAARGTMIIMIDSNYLIHEIDTIIVD